jgi:hypothetical protein
MVLHLHRGWRFASAISILLLSATAAAGPLSVLPASQLLSARLQANQGQALDHDPLSPFGAKEVQAFLKAAAKADTIADPMERCLQYPDPPGSHWTPEGVQVYCRYRLQTTLGFDEFKALIEEGRAAEVDRRLGEWTTDTQGHPEALWRFVNENFSSETPESRRLLESWKQQSPQSAFAHAASGFSFLNAAWAARGAAYSADTAQSKWESMDKILPRVEGDLRMAARLDGTLAMPYAVMIKAGMLVSDRALMQEATSRGWRTDQASMPLYNAIAMEAMPRWGGSVEAQAGLLEVIKREAPRHPLLLTVRATILADQADLYACHCASQTERAAYRSVFDDVAVFSDLRAVGKNALDNGQNELALVYLTEALRFDRNDQRTLQARNQALSGVSSDISRAVNESGAD